MAHISGIGAKKLDSYGDAFLSVILGEAPRVHPTRRKLAGSDAGSVYDRLEEAQRKLHTGPLGTAKPLSCTPATLRMIAQRRPGSVEEIARIQGMDDARTERFGEAFLDALEEPETRVI